MPEYDQHRSVGRQRGNILPHPIPNEPNNECKRYFIDPEKYKTERSMDPISKIETYVAPEVTLESIREIPCENPDVARTRRENFVKKRLEMPSKEDLSADMKEMKNSEIAKKYNVSLSTAEKWLRHYGIQRKKGAMITMGDIEPEKNTEEKPVKDWPPYLDLPRGTIKPIEPGNPYLVPIVELAPEEKQEAIEWRKEDAPEIIIDPTPEQIEEFHTDVPQEELVKNETKEEFEEIWTDVQDDLVVLRAMYIKKAGQDFDRKLSELIKAVSGGEAV